MSTWEEDRAALDKLWAEHRTAYEAVQEQGLALRQLDDALVQRRLDDTTDEQFLADDESRLWLARMHGHHSGAYDRVNKLVKLSPGLMTSHCDGRKEYAGMWLPMLSIYPGSLREREMDLPTLEGVADEMVAWFKVWGLGRRDISFDVLTESDLSWAIHYVTEPEEASVVSGYGRKTVAYSGSLTQSIAWIIKHLSYSDDEE